MSAAENDKATDVLKLKKLVSNKKYDELEKEWIAAVETDSCSTDGFVSVLEQLGKREDKSKNDGLASVLIDAWQSKKSPEIALKLVRRIAEHVHGSADLRKEIGALYRRVYNDCAGIDTVVEMTLGRTNTSFVQAVNQIEALVALRPGSYVSDTSFRSPGKVVGLNAEKKTLTAIFNEQERRYEGDALGRLKPIAPDDFDAMLIFDREKLTEQAFADPETVTIRVLKKFGPAMKFRDLKEQFGRIIGDDNWSKWWNAAKVALKRSPMIDMSSSTQPTFELRSRPVSQAQQMRHQFDVTTSWDDQLGVILAYLADVEGGIEADDVVEKHFANELTRKFDNKKSSAGMKLAAIAIYGQLAKRGKGGLTVPAVDIPALMTSAVDPSLIMTDICNDDAGKLVVQLLIESLGDTALDTLAAMIPSCSVAVCDDLANRLIAANRAADVTAAAHRIASWPDRYTRGTLWLWGLGTSKKRPDFLAEIDNGSILSAILAAINTLKRNSPFVDEEYAKRISQQMRTALGAEKYNVLRQVLKSTHAERIGAIRDAIPRNAGLTDILRHDLVRLIHQAHPELTAVKKLPMWQEDVLYTTRQALDRRQAEYADLVNVKIAENAKAIGHAAERGDLSENAEYTAALEERDRLTRQAGEVREQLTKAKILESYMVVTEHVSVGTEVRTLNLTTNQEETFVFLGPWDSDPQRRILSYQAPLSQAFMGKVIGDEVSYDSGTIDRWKVLAIHSALT